MKIKVNSTFNYGDTLYEAPKTYEVKNPDVWCFGVANKYCKLINDKKVVQEPAVIVEIEKKEEPKKKPLGEYTMKRSYRGRYDVYDRDGIKIHNDIKKSEAKKIIDDFNK